MREFDICVVGAGPAGSSCARLLALQGRRVALIDRVSFPRDKTCGDGITPRGARILERMGTYAAVAKLAHPNRGVTIRASRVSEFAIPFVRDAQAPSDLLVIPRFKLDAALLEEAIAAGVTFFSDIKVTEVREPRPGACEVVVEGEVFAHCQVAIVATGAESQLLRHSGLMEHKPPLEHAARAYFEDVAGLDENVILFFDGVDLPGYGWIFPVSPTSANIGCGVFSADGPSQASLLRRLIAEHPRIREMLSNARQVGPIKAFPLRTDYHAGAAGKGNRLCIGEAAGLVNPVTGEGIDYAFESAEFAACAIADHWQSPRSSERIGRQYRASLRRRFERRFQIYRWLQRNCLNAQSTTRFVAAMRDSPGLRRLVIDGLFGRARPLAFLRPSVFIPLLRVALRQSRQ